MILAAADSKEPGGSEAAAALMHDRRVTRAWCALQFVSQALKTSDGAIGPFLAPHLLAFLPCLLKLQVLCRSDLPQLHIQVPTPSSTICSAGSALHLLHNLVNLCRSPCCACCTMPPATFRLLGAAISGSAVVV